MIMAARSIVASTNHGKEYRFMGLVFGPRAQRYDLTAEQADELERRLKDRAPIDIEPIPTKVAKVEKEARQQIRDLERRIAEVEKERDAARATLAEREAEHKRRVEELEALLEEATAATPTAATPTAATEGGQ
jgi:DNA repair exonuclease SbcCD ATPase subunit